MAGDPYFRKVASLLPFEAEVAGYDPNWRSLAGYARLTEAVAVDLGTALTVVGSPYITEVAGKKAMLLDGASYIYFTITKPLNFVHTIELEVYVASIGAEQWFLSCGLDNGSTDITLGISATGTWGWKEQSVTRPNSVSPTTVGWHSVAIVFTGNNGSAGLYVDGERVAYSTGVAAGTYLWRVVQLGRSGSVNAGNGTAIRNLRVYRGVALYTAPTYTVVTKGEGAVGRDETGRLWFEGGAPQISTAQAAFGGASLRCDGASYLYAQGLALGASDFTAELMIFLAGVDGYPRLIGQWQTTAPHGWIIDMWPDGHIEAAVCTDSDATFSRLHGPVLSQNEWHHIAIQRAGPYFMLITDGVVADWHYSPGALPAIFAGISCCTDNLAAGGAVSNFVVGHIDEVRVTVGVARYSHSVADAFAANVALFLRSRLTPTFSGVLSTNAKGLSSSGTLTQIATTLADGQNGYATYFNGSSQLSVPSHADFNLGAGPMTIECWVKRENNAQHSRLIFFGTNGNANSLQFTITDGGQFLVSNAIASSTVLAYSPDAAVPFGQWTHLAAVFETTSTLTLYVNGVQVARTTGNTPLASQSYPVTIGMDTGMYYKGAIYDVRITKAARYTEAFTPQTRCDSVIGTTPFPTAPHPTAATAVSGVVRGSDNNPCERKVFAYSHETGRYLGEATSDPVTGVFSIAVPERAFAVALDTDASGQNALVLDRLDPV